MNKDIWLPYIYVFLVGSIIFFYGIYIGFKYKELSFKDREKRKDFFVLIFILLFYMIFQGFFQFIAPKI